MSAQARVHSSQRVQLSKSNTRRLFAPYSPCAKKARDWGYRLPKKSVRLATRMALLSKFQDGEAIVVDDGSLTPLDALQLLARLKQRLE